MRKKCSVCKNNIFKHCFHKDKSRKDGFSNKCKKCTKYLSKKFYIENRNKINNNCKNYYIENRKNILVKTKTYRSKNLIECRKRVRDWKKKNPKRVYNINKSYRIKYPKKYYAHWKIRNEIKKGNIPKVNSLKCKICNKNASHYHHENYDFWDKVIPLCRTCHINAHLNH